MMCRVAMFHCSKSRTERSQHATVLMVMVTVLSRCSLSLLELLGQCWH